MVANTSAGNKLPPAAHFSSIDKEHRSAEIVIFSFIAVAVFLSRYLTRGEVYFVDGPRMVRAILNHTYVIQPPGYWLYCRLGSLFSDPAFGLTFLNELFSATGTAVFFLLCRRLRLGLAISVVAAFAYSTIFFLWFAGDVQSSYASQVLFAPLTVLSFLLYAGKPSTERLIACALSFAIGAGLRPSDGAFLVPLFVFLLFHCVQHWQQRVVALLLTIALCLAWYVPTQMALHASHTVRLGGQLNSLAHLVSPLLAGIDSRSIANILRVVLPFFAAFWMLIPGAVMRRRDPIGCSCIGWICGLWIVPGLLFFTLIYMADATYLTFLAGGAVLLAATVANQRVAAWLLTICIAFNVALFVGGRPLASDSRPAAAINFYVVKYCHYGIRHRWSSTIGQSLK